MCMPTDTFVKPLDGKRRQPLLRRFLQEEYEGNQKTLLLKKGCRAAGLPTGD